MTDVSTQNTAQATSQLETMLPKSERAAEKVAKARKAAKEFLDYVKHLILAATVAAAADKSQNYIIQGLAFAMKMALIFYVITLLSQYQIKIYKSDLLNLATRFLVVGSVAMVSIKCFDAVVEVLKTYVLH